MDEISNPTTIWGAAGGAVAAAIAGVFWVRKMLASTAADVAGDQREFFRGHLVAERLIIVCKQDVAPE